MDNDGEPDGSEADTEADTEDGDDIDDDWEDQEDEDVGETEDYSEEESLEANNDDVQDDGEVQTEDTDSNTDGNEADGDMDNDGEPDGSEADTEADTEDGDDIDDNDEEDPGELEDYSDDDSENRNEGAESTDGSDSEREQEEEEQAAEEENQKAAERAEDEAENADVHNADNNVDDAAESENRNPSENGAEQQNEPAETESTQTVDTENEAPRNDTETQNDSADNKNDSSTDTRDQNEEQPDDTNSRMENKSETPVGEDAYRTAMNNMADYMNGHNYGLDDYSEYSQDPEWQKLNADLQQSLGMDVTTDVSTPLPESGKDVSATELPDNCVMVNASDIDMTYAQGMDSDQFWNHHGNTKEDYMRIAEGIPDVQQVLDSGKSLDEIKQDPDLKDTAHAYFDPENMNPVPLPDPENGTVDIEYNLVSKANDQIEFSAGWGQTGVIGKLSLKFTNFSMKNFLNPKTYKGIIPQGEGQTLTLSGQTNGRYYQAYSISFMDPWFGGKRPNTLSVSAYFSKQTDISSNYLTNSGYGYGYPGYGYGYPGYYGGGYGYGSNYYGNYGYNNSYEYAYDPDKSIMMFGLAAGYGKRLNWPDDYFQFMATLNYQLYMMHDWDYFLVNNGNCHNINLELMLQRNSIDNPLYTRKGSQFMLSVAATPPYSLFDGKDYASMSSSDPDKYKFIEYHKWKFKAKIFSPLAPLTVKRTPVLMTRVEYGFLGTYNKNKKSPFETFYMGGDGMSGYSSTYAQETIGLRGYENGSIAGNGGYNSYGYAYSRLAMELRYPFLLEPSSTIYGLVFVEAGNAWTDLKNFNPFNLKRSAGVGVRIFLPMIGLMGLDWAYGFDEPNYGSNGKRSGSNLHFIIGQEF